MACNYILRAKKDVNSPLFRNIDYENGPKHLRAGTRIMVASRCPNGPDSEEFIGAMLLAGYCTEEAFQYQDSTWSNTFEIVGEEPLDQSLVNAQWDAQLHRERYKAKRVNNTRNTHSSSRSSGSWLSEAKEGFSEGWNSHKRENAQKAEPNHSSSNAYEPPQQVTYNQQVKRQQAPTLEQRMDQVAAGIAGIAIVAGLVGTAVNAISNSSVPSAEKKGSEPLWVKVIFTIFPILVEWWFLKFIFYIFLCFSRFIISKPKNLRFPSYSFIRW